VVMRALPCCTDQGARQERARRLAAERTNSGCDDAASTPASSGDAAGQEEDEEGAVLMEGQDPPRGKAGRLVAELWRGCGAAYQTAYADTSTLHMGHDRRCFSHTETHCVW